MEWPLQTRQAAATRPEMPAPMVVMVSEMEKEVKDIGRMEAIGEQGKQGSISHERADVTVVDT